MRRFAIVATCILCTQVLSISSVNNTSANVGHLTEQPVGLVNGSTKKVNATVLPVNGTANGAIGLLNGSEPLVIVAQGLLEGLFNGKDTARPIKLLIAPAGLLNHPVSIANVPGTSRIDRHGSFKPVEVTNTFGSLDNNRGIPVNSIDQVREPVNYVNQFGQSVSQPPTTMGTVNEFDHVTEPARLNNHDANGAYGNVPDSVITGDGGTLVPIIDGNKVIYVVRPDGMGTGEFCRRDVYQDYRKSQIDFQARLFKQIASHTNEFLFSPYSIWLSLAALAEGAASSIQPTIFKYLNLPQELCLRRKYYDLALDSEVPGRDVSFDRRRVLALDNGVRVNPAWLNFVNSTSLLGVAYAQIRANPEAARLDTALKGNSLVLDSLNYHALWTTEFSTVSVRGEPFYNDFGQQIGTIKMMRMRKRVRLAYVPSINVKVLELPVGVDGRYTMLIAVSVGNNVIRRAVEPFMRSIDGIFSMLQMSSVPFEIAVPQYNHEMQFDARNIVQAIGLGSFWSNPAATSYVSQPPALPGGLIQLVTVRFGPDGINPSPADSDSLVQGIPQYDMNTDTGLPQAVGHDFIANRPFLYALFDTKTQTCLFAGVNGRQNRL